MNDTEASGATPREQGLALMKQGRFREAAVALRQAVEENPADESSWRFLGGALSSSGDPEAAITAFEQAATLLPASAKNHYNLAIALQGTERLYEARSHLEQAIALDPGYEQARSALKALGTQADERGYGGTAVVPDPPTAPPVRAAVSAPGRMTGADDLAMVGGIGDAAPAASPGMPPAAPPSPYAPVSPPPYAGATTTTPPPPVLGMHYGMAVNTSGAPLPFAQRACRRCRTANSRSR